MSKPYEDNAVGENNLDTTKPVGYYCAVDSQDTYYEVQCSGDNWQIKVSNAWKDLPYEYSAYAVGEWGGPGGPGGGQQGQKVTVTKDNIYVTKLGAMKDAACAFVDQVAAQEGDHQIAIVSYNGSATQNLELKGAESGKETLKNSINGLTVAVETVSGVGTKMHTGLEKANGIFTDALTERTQVVVLLTDGVPSESDSSNSNVFSVDLANQAITQANSLKDKNVLMYSIGIFSGANPKELYGEKWEYEYYQDVPCNGNKGDHWGGSWVASLGSNDFPAIDVPAGNRLLNYISNNYTASEIGVERGTYNPSGLTVLSNGTGYEITEVTAPGSWERGYYQTANDLSTLNSVFTTISSTVSSTTVTLDASAVLKDTISDYFGTPTNVTAKVVSYANDTPNATLTNQLSTNSSNGVVTVSGFDYSAQNNLVTDEGDGHKLVVTYSLSVKSGFLGGNGVNVGDAANCGIYASGADSAFENFKNVTVDIPIPDIMVSGLTDKNVYLLGGVTEAQMLAGAKATATGGGATLKLDNSSNYGLAEWQNKFVNITVNATVSADAASNLTEDTDYTVTCEITPTNKTGSASEKTGTGTANIYVYKPELTYPDYTVYLGGTVPTFTASSTAWKHTATDNTVTSSTDTGVTMLGSEPTVDVTFDTSGLTNCTTIGTSTGNDTRISDVKIGETSVKDHVTIKDFKVHVLKPTVTFKDTYIYLGSSADFKENYVSTAWGDNDGTETTGYGDAPTLTFTYNQQTTGLTQCTNVSVASVQIGITDITAQTSFAHQTAGRANGSGHFTVHVYTPTVTFQDTAIYLSKTADYNDNIASVTWACNDSNVPASGNAAPALSYEYSVPAAAFTECTGVSVSKVTINGTDYTNYVTLVSSTQANQTMLAALFSTRSADTPHFTVHVLRPTLIFADSTIYLGNSADFGQNYLSNDTTWSDQCGGNNTASGPAPTVTPSYDETASTFENCTAVKVNSVKIESTDYSNFASLVTMKNDNSTLGADNATFTVHVVKPVITNSETTIYLGGTADLNEQMNENANWTCTDTGNAQKSLPVMDGNTRKAPTVSHSFTVNGTGVGTSYGPTVCTEVTVTSKVGNFAVTPKDNDNTFTVHVLVPRFTVTAQDLWADVGTNVTLFTTDNTDTDVVKQIEKAWVYSGDCQGHDSTCPDGAPEVNVTDVTFSGTGVSDGKVTVTEDNITVTVTGVKYTIGDDAGEYTTGTVGEMANGTVTSTLHANTFVLKIKNESGQNAIFDLKKGGTALNQVAVPSGSNTTDVYGLYCGSGISYTLSEENGWSWRYSGAVEVTSGITHNNGTAVGTSNCGAEVEVTISYGDKTNDKWLSGQNYVINTAASTDSISLQSLWNAIVPNKKEGEVAN